MCPGLADNATANAGASAWAAAAEKNRQSRKRQRMTISQWGLRGWRRPAWERLQLFRRSDHGRPCELHVAVEKPAVAAAAMENAVVRLHFAGGKTRLLGELLVIRTEVRLGRFDQLLETVDHEIGFLKGVDAIARAHDPMQVEADAIGRIRFQAVEALAFRTHDARTVNAQT